MQTLSPVKAIVHALNSIVSYRSAAIRIGMFWVPVMFALNVVELLAGAPAAAPAEFGPANFIPIASAIVGILGFSSMAVNWHRFILRDEIGAPARLDANVLRYAGNSLLIMMAIAVPLVAVSLLIWPSASPGFAIILLPLFLVLGAVVIRLSIKLPAVALGRREFSFRDAWAASEGNWWQIAGLLILNALVVLAAVFVIMLVLKAISMVSVPAALVASLVLNAVVGLFLTLFNASIFTSLYGFFVERRSF